MRVLKIIFITIGLALGALLFNACSDDDGYSLGNYWIDLATVVPVGETTYYLRMDDGTTLWPAATNAPYYKPKENQRAMVNFTLLSDSQGGYDHYVKVNRIDDVLTKNMAESKGDENNTIYGNDPVEIRSIWIGDGYLNVYFRTLFGYEKTHFVNLIPSDDEDAHLEFRHNAYDDPQLVKASGLVAFNLSQLNEIIEPEGQDTITLTIKVNTFDGNKLFNVKYVPSSLANTNTKYFNDVFLEGLN